MKSKSTILAAALLMILTTAHRVWAEDEVGSSHASLTTEGPTRLSDLGVRLNPQIGVSSFEYSNEDRGSNGRFAGGATFEFGEGMRRLETGVLLVPTGGDATLADGSVKSVHSELLTLPVMAKIRVLQMPSQSWFIKLGFLTAFEVGSNDGAATNDIDVLGSAGLSGRFAFTRRADFIIEATYNRGLLEAVRSGAATTDYNQGVLALAGVSFRI